MGPKKRMMAMSREMATSAPGRCTLTATSRTTLPLSSSCSALYTCPRLALASGLGLSRSRPARAGVSWLEMMRRAASSPNGGTSSWSVRSRSMYGAGRRSCREDRTCPSLTYVGPSRTSSTRSCSARTESILARASSSSSGRRPSLASITSAVVNAPRRMLDRSDRFKSVSGFFAKNARDTSGSYTLSSSGSSSPSFAAKAAHSFIPDPGSPATYASSATTRRKTDPPVTPLASTSAEGSTLSAVAAAPASVSAKGAGTSCASASRIWFESESSRRCASAMIGLAASIAGADAAASSATAPPTHSRAGPVTAPSSTSRTRDSIEAGSEAAAEASSANAAPFASAVETPSVLGVRLEMTSRICVESCSSVC
mmetsp:Transcript_31518/g.102688  ORF Transcript_31518/g.102688 Transcript_31518/m.102688 type:complete len:370 (-) Transcript_31518:554-1663(-)